MKVLKRILYGVITVLMLCSMVSVNTVSLAASKKVKKITLNKTSVTVYVGGAVKLTADVSPSDATNKQVTWSTGDKKVATVSSSGKITAKKVGNTTITVKAKDGSGKKATCKVTVKKRPVKSIALNKTKATLKVNGTLTLKATITPTNATNKKVTWKSSNTKVASVSTNGKVTAKNSGTATITATTVDGAKKATCKITVKNVSGSTTNTSEPISGYVWIPVNGGTKYHAKSTCSNMKNPQKVTVKEAKSQGYTPCARCY